MRSIAILLLLFFSALPERTAQLRAGAATVEITPTQLPVLVNGGFLSRRGKSVRSKLHARALVLDDGNTKLAIVIIDTCVMPRELFDPAKAEVEKKTGIPVSNILMAATHTHA